jgi:hypothetical protein
MPGRRASRRTVAAVAAVVALAAIGLALGISWGSGSSHLSWTPTESRKPVRTVVVSPGHTYTFDQAVKAGITPSLEEAERESGLPLCGTKPPARRAAYEQAVKRNDGDTCMADPRKASFSVSGTTRSFFAVNAVPDGHDMLRYVDSAGWAIAYPAPSTLSHSRPPPAQRVVTKARSCEVRAVPDAAPPIPPRGVVLAITRNWDEVSGWATLGRDSRFPLRLPSTFKRHATGWMRRTDFDFQGNGAAYHVSIVAGPEASRADLDAIARMVASIAFPPTTADGARASGGRSPRGS